MSTGDNENGTKSTASGTRSRKTSDKEKPQNSDSPKRKRTGESAAAPKKTAAKAKAADSKAAAAKTAAKGRSASAPKKKAAAAGSSKSAAGTAKKTTGAGRSAKKTAGIHVESPAVPNNVVQFPGAGGRSRPRPAPTGAGRTHKAQSSGTGHIMNTFPAGEAAMLAFEGAELLSEEISTTLGDLVDVALMTSGVQEELADAAGDLGDALEAILVMLSEVHIKIGVIVLLTPPENIVRQVMPKGVDLSEYTVLVNKSTEALGELGELIQDVYHTGQRTGVSSAIRLLVEESTVDQLDELSEAFDEMSSVLGAMVAELDSLED